MQNNLYNTQGKGGKKSMFLFHACLLGGKRWLLCTCCDDISSSLEGLVIKMMLLTQRKNHVHFCVTEVHFGNGCLEDDSREERRGGACGGAGPLHLDSWQAVINLEAKKWHNWVCIRKIEI